MHVAVEENQLISFLDANNLETGLNFKMAFMEAISRSLVACPVVSAGAVERLFQIRHSDYCDNVLLEWACMLTLMETVEQMQTDGGGDLTTPSKHVPPLFLRRVAPLIVSRAWHNSDLASNQDFSDTFDDLKALCQSLPDTVSDATWRPLEHFFETRLQLPAPRRMTVREVVMTLLDMDAIFCWESSEPSAVRTHQLVERTAMVEAHKWDRLREYAGDVRQVVLRAKQLAQEDEALQAAVDAGLTRSAAHMLGTTSTDSTPAQGAVKAAPDGQAQEGQGHATLNHPAPPASKPVAEWTEKEVLGWLAREKFDAMLDTFSREHVDGQLLCVITDDMLAQELVRVLGKSERRERKRERERERERERGRKRETERERERERDRQTDRQRERERERKRRRRRNRDA